MKWCSRCGTMGPSNYTWSSPSTWHSHASDTRPRKEACPQKPVQWRQSPWVKGEGMIPMGKRTKKTVVHPHSGMSPTINGTCTNAANMLRAGARHKDHTLYDFIYFEVQIGKCANRKWFRGCQGLGGDR